ncbi:interleukin-15 receptor subunit alpha isoform X1 [Dipodomys spectabilis]|uniref:interleukin-15 receptor subunit alpha isoform X1 n=1 Tax=Dipodomys spectabilis TaxID=105255 RepID=UPI001C542B57|nr:interleukin-15 receptor subunit alpha isoform X1 [Dipodomys spectabilis]
MCPSPMSVEHADINIKSYHVSSRERYVCNSGFKRKAGTSSLIECVFNETTNTAQWTMPSLRCIRDPSLTHQRLVPPSTVVTTKVTPHPESPSRPGQGVHPHSRTSATVAISTSVTLTCGVCVLLVMVWCIRSRRTSQPPATEMEPMEVMPMAADTGHSGAWEPTRRTSEM